MSSATPTHAPDAVVLSRLDLLALGFRPKQITRGVRTGTLIRVRRDHYVFPGVGEPIARAVRIGGRLSCVSAIALIAPEVFVFSEEHTHVQVPRKMSRLRMPDDRDSVWDRSRATGVRVHWSDCDEAPEAAHVVHLADAVREMVKCLPAREALATLDSLLHNRIMTMWQLRDAFGSLPTRFAPLLRLVDARAESGPETFMRILLTELGVRFDVQVRIKGVGRVDFVVDGFLIIECDSKAYHEGWAKQREDRRRDLAAAERGYVTLRLLAEDLMYDQERVREALHQLLAALEAWGGR